MIESDVSTLPNLFNGSFSTFAIGTLILMVPIRIVCRQITASEESMDTISIGIQAPKNLDSLFLNIFLLFLMTVSVVLNAVYWKG